MSVRIPSKELKEKAKKELNEDDQRTPEDIKYIKTWINQTKYLNARTDDQWILSFLRGCKFSLERTKEKLEFFYTLRSVLPELFQNRDPLLPELQEILDIGIFLPLPKTVGDDSPKIMLMRGAAYDPAKIDIKNIFKLNTMMIDIMLLEDDHFVIAGGEIIQDLDNITMGHMAPPALMKKVTTIMQDGYPIRPKRMHFINIPSFFETVYSIIKPFFKEKMTRRMIIHTSNNLDDLYKTVPKNLWPKEYGGDGPTIKEIAGEWKKKIESYRQWFLDDAVYKTDEKKRPGKPKTSDELFGIEGSFRKLNVD